MLRRTLLVAAAVLPLVLVACGSRAAGYGVILWGEPNGTPQTGAVVAIVRDTLINNSVLISAPGEKTPREYLAGRIRPFKTRSLAADFARTYAANVADWAIVTKTDDPPLPMRDAPKAEGKVVYKLAAKQLVKVVSRSDVQVTVNPYTDYWYEVVTEDGYTG